MDMWNHISLILATHTPVALHKSYYCFIPSGNPEEYKWTYTDTIIECSSRHNSYVILGLETEIV